VLRLVYIGNVELRYLFEKVARFVAVNQRAGARVVLRVLTRADHGYVNSALRQQGVQEGSWSIDSVPHSAMPAELQQQDAGLFFLTQGLSEHGCSPTKVGEYWASGLPVVTTPNAGDSADVVERDQIGVVVRSHDDEAYAAAGAQLIRLLRSPGLVPRCRLAAEAHYGLKGACEAQLQLYRTIGMLAAV
jgi:glycosyltransferase involved in cell wall biosynthesis